MKSSEVEAAIAARAGQQEDWKRTHIAMSLGAAETQPYARDAAIAGVHRHKRLHAMLDQMLCDSDIVQGEHSQLLHTALDQLLDADPNHEPWESEEDSASEDEDGGLTDKILDTLDRMSRKSHRLRSSDARRSVAHDAAPNKICLCFMNGALDRNSYKKLESGKHHELF